MSVFWLLPGCATQAKEQPLGSVPAHSSSALRAGTRTPAPAPTVSSERRAAQTTPAPAASTDHPPTESATGSAYFGCGERIPLAKLWDETTESQVLEAISTAKACAAEHGRRLLLEFVAPWCEDCQEMAKLDEAPLVAATMRQRFERVRINVGKWDRHEGLRKTFGVRALATYVVIDPNTSQELAKTTLEPITKPGRQLTAGDWAQWLKAH